MIDAYPLSWPAGWPRTAHHERRRAAFSRQRQRPFGAVRDELLDELRMLGVQRHSVVLSTNIPLRQDGLPYAKFRIPDDLGVAVYFELDGEQKCFPCDKWDRIEDNIRAISLTINALRGIERWGSKQMIDAAFAGFAALPAGGEGTGAAWWDVLGVSQTITRYGLDTIWRSVVREHHPDAGGDPLVFLRMKAAYEQGKAALS